MNADMDSGGHGQKRLSTDIWIVGIYIADLPGLNVKAVAMNIFWRFLVSGGTSAPPVTRSGSLNSANGYARKF